MTKAHGSVFSQGTVRGEYANVLLGRLCKSANQSTLMCLNRTTKKTVEEGPAKETRKKTDELDGQGNGLRKARSKKR